MPLRESPFHGDLLLSLGEQSHFGGHGHITFGIFNLTPNGLCGYSQMTLNHRLFNHVTEELKDGQLPFVLVHSCK